MELKNVLQKIFRRWLERRGRRPELRQVIWVSFTVTAVATAIVMGISYYGRFSAQTRDTFSRQNQILMEQAGYSFSTYLRSMIKISDSLYYSVIKKTDLQTDSVSDSFQLMYDTNKEHIERIALFSMDGTLIETAPAGRLKRTANILREDWYWDALESEENIYFGKPAVAHLFELSSEEYSRIVPMTRIVQITEGDRVKRGILLIQLKYNDFQDILSDSLLGDGSYFYLTDSEGEILYHPQQQLLQSGYMEETRLDLSAAAGGGYLQTQSGDGKDYFVKTIGYTGWRLIGVTQTQGVVLSNLKSGLFIGFLMLFFLSIIAVVNGYISRRVSAPMASLEEAVNEIEAGRLDTDIQPSGFYEIWHLGQALDKMKGNLKRLMEDIVLEHESKRRSELMALQNQINPHFLYNTLDIIVWMIENEKSDDAVNVVTALARFFRISLSRGRTVITVADEVEHVRNYLMIQKMRFKNRFSYSIQMEEGAGELGTIKLILQPLVENAVYHAMEFMDGDGEIEITVKRRDADVFFTIRDNGCGMTQTRVQELMGEGEVCSERGAGVGLRNVRERIRLVFGDEYGLSIASEPDEGTEITIRIPAITYPDLRERGID